MFEELLKEALKKSLENGIFIIILVWFGRDMMVRQDRIMAQNEAKAEKIQKTAIETIDKIARQRDNYHDQLIQCLKSKINDN